MADLFGAAAFALVVAVIVGLIILFSGDPDIADGMRCRYLEIPMSRCFENAKATPPAVKG